MQSIKNKKGFTLIELLVSITVIAIISIVFIGLFVTVLRFVQFKRIQTVAAALATERMEIVRNIPYDDVGVLGGIPLGVINGTTSIIRSGIDFTVATDVRYIDDPYDGIQGGIPDDTLNIDYKRVKITISWTDTPWTDGSMFFLTDVAPKGVETTLNGGTLRLRVFDAVGVPVSLALVDIINPGESVSLIDVLTNTAGEVLLPGSPVSTNGYEITVNKGGFSESRTYGVNDPAGNIAPSRLHLSVFDGVTTEASFAIDVTSQLTIGTYENVTSTPPLSFDFGIRGAKIIGEDAAMLSIYKASTTAATSGAYIYGPIEWDTYTLSFDQSALGYNIVSYDPPTNPITVLPGVLDTINFYFEQPYATTTLLVTIKNQTSTPIVGASIRLVHSTTSYDTTLVTGASGQVFFKNLGLTDYNATTTYPGYTTLNTSIVIDGNNEEKLQMFPL